MSFSRSIGSLVVRIVADGLGAYKADMNAVAGATEEAAGKIDKSTKLAGAAAAQMGGDLAQAADAAQALQAGAGLAAVGVGVLVVGLAAGAYAAYKGAQEQIEYQKALTLTGNVSGTTAGQMADMARVIGQGTGTQYQAAAALAALAGTGQIAGSSLQKLGDVAVDTQRTLGVSVQDTAKLFAELGEEPVKASLKLNESMHYLTASTFEQIKAAQDLGDAEKAASLAQDAYADAMKTRTADIESSLGTLEKVWRGLKNEAKSAWDVMLGLGRESTTSDLLAKTQDMYTDSVNSSGADSAASKDLAARVIYYQRMIASEGSLAAHQADRIKREESSIALAERAEKFASNQVKMQREIAQAQQQLANSNMSAADYANYEQAVVGITNRYKESGKVGKTGSKDNSAEREIEAQEVLLSRLSGFNSDYEDSVNRLVKLFEKGRITAEGFNGAVQDLVSAQPGPRAANDASMREQRAQDREDEKTRLRLQREQDQNAREVGGIRTSLNSPAQREDAAYKARIKALEKFKDLQLANVREANELIELEEARHIEWTAQSKEAGEAHVLDIMSQSTGQLYGLMKQAGLEQTALGKVAFLAQQGLAVAQIIMNTNAAAAAALTLPPVGLGPVAGMGFASAIKAMGYASAGMVAGLAIADVAGGRASGGPVDAGKLYEVNERGPEVLSTGGRDFLMMGANSGRVLSNPQSMAALGGNAGSGGNVTIINNSRTPLTKATQQTLPNGDRAVIVDEAANTAEGRVIAQLSDPNSRMSRAMSRNFATQRSR